jgi:outer membrane protein assembly factor BamB
MALDIKKFCSGENPVVWDKDDFQGPNVSTPVIAKGMLFIATDTGRIQCLDCRDGAVLWRERFKGLLYASPVVVGEHVYFSNDRGRTIVVAAESQFRKVAESDLGEKIFASPAPVDGLLYVRAGPYLYCLRGP